MDLLIDVIELYFYQQMFSTNGSLVYTLSNDVCPYPSRDYSCSTYAKFSEKQNFLLPNMKTYMGVSDCNKYI